MLKKFINNKIISIMLLFVMILNIVSHSISYATGETNGTGSVDNLNSSGIESTQVFTRFYTDAKNEDGTEKRTYLNLEPVLPYAEVRLGESVTNLQNVKLKLIVPKKYLKEEPTWSDTTGMTSKELTQDGENYYMVYNYDLIEGGQSIGIPIPYRFSEYTPDGTEMDIKFEVISEDNQVIKEEIGTFTAKSFLGNDDFDIKFFHNKYAYFPKSKELDGKQVYVNKHIVDEGEILTKTGNAAPKAELSINIRKSEFINNLNYGTFLPKVKIDVKLPEGAVMNGSIGDNGKYNYNNGRTFDWTFDENTRIATYIGEMYYYNDLSLHSRIDLSFPGQSFDNIYEIKETVTLNPGEKNEKILPERNIFIKFEPEIIKINEVQFSNFVVEKLYKYRDSESYSPNYGGKYIFKKNYTKSDYNIGFKTGISSVDNGRKLQNGDRREFYVTEIIEKNLDDRMFFKNISLNYNYGENTVLASYDGVMKVEKAELGNYKIFGVKEDNTEVLLGQNLVENEVLEINDDEDIYKNLRIVFEKPILMNGKRFSFNIGTELKQEYFEELKNSDLKSYGDNSYSNLSEEKDRYHLYADVKYFIKIGENISDSTREIKNYIYFVKDILEVSFSRDLHFTTTYIKNNVINFGKELSTYAVSGTDNFNDLKLDNLRILYLFPEGIEFISFDQKIDGENIVKINNYKNSGKNAVIRELGDLNYNGNLSYRFLAMNFAKEGINEIDIYAFWDNEESEINHNSNSRYLVKDILDLDGDGNIEETFIKITDTLTFIPPREVIVKKRVSEDNQNYTLNSNYIDLGKNNFYEISIYNNSLNDISNVTLLDILPEVGDKSIVADINGVYQNRGSEFLIGLSENPELLPENLKILEKFSVLYSLEGQGNTTEESIAKNFVPASEIRDFNQVKMIKLVLKNGEKLEVKEELKFFIKTKIPTNRNIFEKAVNSAAASLNGRDFFESNRVTSEVVKYKVKGKVFLDNDKSGALDSEDIGLVGYKVELFKSDGTSTGKITNSDTDGNYEFEVLERGDYFVKFFKKNNLEELSPVYNGNGEGNDFSLNSDDVTNLTAKTEIFSLNTLNINKTEPFSKDSSLFTLKNIGLVLNYGKIKITKTDLENGQKLANTKFEIKKGEEIVDTIVTNNEGVAISKDLQTGINYTISEKEAPVGYVVSTDIKNILLDSSLKEENFTNKKIYGKVIFEKVDRDDNTIKIPGVKFVLTQNGQEKYEAISDKNGIVKFENVVFGDYILKEKETVKGYNLSTETKKVSIITDGLTVDLRNFVNKKITGKVILEKVDKDDNTIKISGVKFVLIQNGQEKYESISDENGVVKFENIIYGDYILKEKETKTGYNLSLEEKNLSVVLEGETINLGSIENEKIKSTVLITKVDSENKEYKISGVKFILEQNGEEKYEAITGNNGVAEFKNVEFGDYILKEKETISGYVLSNETKNVSVKNNLEIIDLGDFSNKKITGKVILEKIGNNDKNQKLKGAEFGLFKNGQEKYKSVSDENGKVVFENVEYGEYILKETKAPENFRLSGENREVSIKNEGGIIDLGTFSNELDGRPPVIPNIPDNPKVSEAPKPIETPKEEPKKDFPPVVVEPEKPVEPTPEKKFVFDPVAPIEIFGETKIITFVKTLAKTGSFIGKVETKLPNKKYFKLAGTYEKDIKKWLEVLPRIDRTRNKYIVIPSNGLIMPVGDVEEGSDNYNKFINGEEENFYKYLENGSVELPGTSTRGYGEVGNKVIIGHSSFWKDGKGRYKTHFQKIIGLEKGTEIWIFEKNEKGEFNKFIYKVTESYNTNPEDISVLKPTNKSQLTLFTCTPIGGILGRWIIKSEFVGQE